jgi:hypothetical protein
MKEKINTASSIITFKFKIPQTLSIELCPRDDKNVLDVKN